MPSLRVSLETFSEVIDRNGQSTFLIICVLDLRGTDDVIEVVVCKTGQCALDFLNRLDRPNAEQAVVGVQLALPPQMSKEAKWMVQPVLDFTRITFDVNMHLTDTYAYRVASGQYFTDDKEISAKAIRSVRSIYQASNAELQADPELSAFQFWIAKILRNLINEACTLP